ncbi:MAG: hypothetical protein P0121_10275 [Nitrospira sp.]|nr:hypothetical protein [Nitrospira sp.]
MLPVEKAIRSSFEPEYRQGSDHPLDRHGTHGKCPHLLRRAEAIIEDMRDTLVFLTNHHGPGASTIVPIHKDRWQIEFFKALKQNLTIKTFVSASVNAVNI